MANEKPLPATPLTPVALSVEGRKHRLRFIRQALEENELGLSGNVKDGWEQCIEEALDELGNTISRGGWLTGVKQGRAQRVQRRVAKNKAERREKPSSSTPETPEDSPSSLTMRQVKDLVAQSFTPVPKAVTKHLLLCIAPLGSRIAAPKDFGIPFPSSIGCKFASGVFTLPDEDAHDGAHSAVLLGLDGWDANILDGPTRLVGGTFTLEGGNSTSLHQVLVKTLRVATYVHLSLILEQHFLSDSHVTLNIPRPRILSAHQSFQLSPSQSTPDKGRQRQSFMPSPGGILSFISKKAGLYRSNSISSVPTRGGSLDLERPAPEEPEAGALEDASNSPFRRFSFIHDAKASFFKATSPVIKEDSDSPFTDTVEKLRQNRAICSTSPDVEIPLPSLIVDLCEKERHYPSRRLKGDEKTGLASILGWEGKKARGSGMVGTTGFARHQGISVLYIQYIPSDIGQTVQVPPTADPSATLSSASIMSVETRSTISCGQPQWLTYRYYSKEAPQDRCLGEVITEWVSSAQLPCSNAQCKLKQGQHEQRFIHHNVQISIKIEDGENETRWRDWDDIEMWQSCAVCAACTGRQPMSDGTYLFSFAKFLELLVYSSAIHRLDPPLCPHTSPSVSPSPSPLTLPRFQLHRHFRLGPAIVTLSTSAIEDVFELKVPRLQILPLHAENKAAVRDRIIPEESTDEAKRTLRREIKSWWEGVSDHMDKLEDVVHGDNLAAFRKSLPRLPSSDDAYDDADDTEDFEVDNTTPTKMRISGLPFERAHSSAPLADSENYFDRPTSSSTSLSTPSTTSLSESDPTILLSKLRFTFQRIEQSLYQQLSRTPTNTLNDVRRSFLSASLGASKRLLAWQQKHIPAEVMQHVGGTISCVEPEWWIKGCHALPGGNVIVREDDWGSIISFTLGTADYQRELANMSNPRANRMQPSTPSTTPSTSTSSGTSFFSPSRGFRFFTTSSQEKPDPDQDAVVWHQPESFSSVISRKEHPKDATYLLSIRDALRPKSPADSSAALTPSRFATLDPGSSKATANIPPSAWAKPDVQLNMQSVVGELTNLSDKPESADKILQEIDSGKVSRPPSIIDHSASSDRHSVKASSVSTGSDDTVGRGAKIANDSAEPVPDVPPKDVHSTIGHQAIPTDDTIVRSSQSTSSFANSFSTSIGLAMRFLNNHSESLPPNTPAKAHHGLLNAEGDHEQIDDKPHIKYDWTVGTRLKFSCTVYYAKQFDILRRRCGIEEVYLQSLSRSSNWAAEGGKSRSNFWKTSDDRFIIKTLVNAWNVADLQVLLELAPSYFRYMEATASKSTVLAKLLGFYTIEVRNLESGNVHARADLLVMENLFYQHNIVKTFDLKGIQGRKVKGHSSNGTSQSKTLFDGEWIEGQQRTLTLVRPHSKIVLREAIRSDAEFLAKSNIMDYSLLLGVDEEHKQIACGLVDTIGSYTFAKTLEYKAKQGLNSGKETTVIPPVEYQDRFVNALERYFLACPDKWSLPMDGTKVNSDPSLLPSVL
ncbi:hypothetical protein ONZ45_g5018 [Pleurotus djamor]|nr:hypothetical protein ONZ45_g5018 [Pleurotus djamor]